jgi:hypothetical protein
MDNKGFTLIEIVLIVVVMGILGGFTFAFIEHATLIYTMGTRQTMLYQEASYMMERVAREVRDAKSVLVSENAISIKKTHGTAFDPTLDVTFKLENGNLKRSGEIDQIIGTKVDSFTPSIGTCTLLNCLITIDLVMYDSKIPKYDPNDINHLSRKVSLTTSIVPKNSNSSDTDRWFKGDYEEVIR